MLRAQVASPTTPTPAPAPAPAPTPVVPLACSEPTLPGNFRAQAPTLSLDPVLVIERTTTRSFQVPEPARLKALVLAAGLALATTLPGQAAPPPPSNPPQNEVEQSRQAVAKLLRRDETLFAAGMAQPLPPQPVGMPWGALAALAALTSAGFGAHRFIKKQELSAREAALLQSSIEALGSCYRNARLDALLALQRRPDLRGIPLAPLQLAAGDADPMIAAPAKRLLARHPDTPDPDLRALAERENLLSVRALALHSLESRRLV